MLLSGQHCLLCQLSVYHIWSHLSCFFFADFGTCHFRNYLFQAGIPHRGRGKGPRVHDLRHSFAVHVLNKWSREGKDMYTCLPILRTYLGHSKLSATEKYLRLVPDAYDELTEPFRNRFQKITEALGDEEGS